MTRWALLLRAVNLGPRNKLAMADLRSLLADLGHTDVRTFLNSGNAVFASSRTSRGRLINEIEEGLRDRLDLDVRATLRTPPELEAALDGLPKDLASASYVALAFLFDKPTAARVNALQEWDVSPDRFVVGDGVVYLAYDGTVHTSRLQNNALEKRLGVDSTARTPATIRKLLT